LGLHDDGEQPFPVTASETTTTLSAVYFCGPSLRLLPPFARGAVSAGQAAQDAQRCGQDHDAPDAARPGPTFPLLTELFQEAGCTVTPRTTEAAVLIEAPGLGTADLNRLAAKGGIILRQLTGSTHNLERTFFALTGTASADVSAGQEMGAIR
jgi:hypothetical protein